MRDRHLRFRFPARGGVFCVEGFVLIFLMPVIIFPLTDALLEDPLLKPPGFSWEIFSKIIHYFFSQLSRLYPLIDCCERFLRLHLLRRICSIAKPPSWLYSYALSRASGLPFQFHEDKGFSQPFSPGGGMKYDLLFFSYRTLFSFLFHALTFSFAISFFCFHP